MKPWVAQRIHTLQSSMENAGLDAALIMDRENLIYFAGLEDVECGALVVPVQGDPQLLCLWLDAPHFREQSGIEQVIPYRFPQENISMKSAELIANLGLEKPRIGFTRYFISLQDYQCLVQILPSLIFGDISGICYKIRAQKDEREIQFIQNAADFVSLGMKAAVAALEPGKKETEILAEAEYAMRKAGSEGASFKAQVLRHDRQMLVHPYAGDYEIANNQPVVVHLGASYKGYTAKMCRTVFLGKVPAETARIYETLVEAQRIAAESVAPGAVSADIYAQVYQFIKKQGYENLFLDQIGYGVGIRQAEFYPVLGRGRPDIIRENMVVDLLLPTIYKPKVGGPRITDTYWVRSKGCVKLTSFSEQVLCKP